MYAIVEISGKQYKVEEGRYIDVDFQDLEEGASADVDNVLMLVNGDDIQIGTPALSNVSLETKVIRNYKDKKVIVYKQKPKKGTRLKQGHRQQYTRVMVDSIKVA